MNYLNLNIHKGHLNFIVCLFSILRILSIIDFISYHMLIANLIKTLKSDKLPKKLVRRIVQRFLKTKISIKPELLKLVDVYD